MCKWDGEGKRNEICIGKERERKKSETEREKMNISGWIKEEGVMLVEMQLNQDEW